MLEYIDVTIYFHITLIPFVLDVYHNFYEHHCKRNQPHCEG